MFLNPLRTVVLMAVLLAAAKCSVAYTTVPLSNAEITTFTSGVADYWSDYVVGNIAPPGLVFFPDSANFYSYPYSQGISGIDAIQEPGVNFGAGLRRVVNVTPGRVYFLLGFQDLYEETYAAPPARRYAHFFGIDPNGGLNPPEPFTMGAVRWMGPGQWFYNDMPGNSTQIGGMHRCSASWAAQGSQITIWSGVWVYGDAPVSESPTVFEIDSFMLFEYDNAVRGTLLNPGFETVENLTPGYDPNDIHRLTMPVYWTPVGGGIGQKESYYTEAAFKRSGSAGLRIYNHRGHMTRGMTQRVAVPAGKHGATFSVYVKANRTAGTLAKIGIDPTGGADINSPNIVWTTYTRTDATWQQLSVTSPCVPQGVVSVFVAAQTEPGTTGNVHYADFDDCTLTFLDDLTPPEPFTVSAPTPTTLTGFMSASVNPIPTDPETGISLIEYAVGTTPGSQNIRGYTPVTDPTLILIAALSLSPGQTYYVSVRATNGAGLSTTAVSNPVLCSPRPYTYSWSSVQHLSRTSYSADGVRLAAGPEGKVFAVWRESNDLTWNGSNSLVMFRERTGSVWGEPVKVNTTANQWWPDVAWGGNEIGVPCLSPGSQLQNTLRIAIRSVGGAFAEQYLGPNFSAFTRVAYTPQTGWIIGCKLNTLNDPQKCVPTLVRQKPSWGQEVLPGGAYAASDHKIALCVSGGTTHVLWGRLDSGQAALYYCSRDSEGNYSTPRLVARGTGAGTIAVTGSGVHVAYSLNGEVWYTRASEGGNFSEWNWLGFGTFPSLVAEPSGRIHCLFFKPTGSTNENGVALVAPIHMFKDSDGWSLPSAICSASCTSGIWAQEPGNLVVDSNGGLHFAWSNNPRDRGMQQGQFQGYYWIDYYTTTPVTPEGGPVVQAKLWGDDAPAQYLGYGPSKIVNLASVEVTATGTFKTQIQSQWKSVPYFCVQQQDRVSAIKVIAGNAQDSPLPQISVAPGDLANVSGPIATTNGERTIGYLDQNGVVQGVNYAKSGTASNPIRPLFMSTMAVGGATVPWAIGPTGGVGSNNVGLLVAIVGRVVMTATDERGVKVLYVDDGSNAPCGPATGCKVYAPGSTAQVGNLVKVVGVSSIEPYGQGYIRVVMPRDANSVNVIVE